MTASDARFGRVVAPRRGRPPKPLDPDASCAARLGAELQKSRLAQNLTLQALSDRIGYSLQHVSQVEHGRGTVNEAFLRACEAELDTQGALLRLLPDVILEHARVRSARAAARRSAGIHRKPEDHMDPISRRGLADAGAAAVLSLPGGPGAAGDVGPLLPEHSERLLAILGAHDAAHGPHQMLDIARRELRLIGARCTSPARPTSPTSSPGPARARRNGATRRARSASPRPACAHPARARTHARCAPYVPHTHMPSSATIRRLSDCSARPAGWPHSTAPRRHWQAARRSPSTSCRAGRHAAGPP
jgi:transcriptional regulator with XRE-family HTH domain